MTIIITYLQSIAHSVAELARITSKLIKVARNQLLLLHKLDIRQGISRQLNSLVKTVITSIGDIHDLHDGVLNTGIQHIGHVQLVLQLGTTSEDNTGTVHMLVLNEELDAQLSALADVVVTLLQTQTGETQSGLTSTTVLLGQIDEEAVEHIAGASTDRSVQTTATVHDDESEGGVVLQKLLESLGVELVVAQVERGIDRAEGLEGVGHLLFLSLLVQAGSAVHHETVGRNTGEPNNEQFYADFLQLQLLLGGGNGAQHGETVHTGLNVGSSSILTSQHVGGVGNLVVT